MSSLNLYNDPNCNFLSPHDVNIEENCKDELSPITKKIAEQQQLALLPLKEDLAHWISSLTGHYFGDKDLMEYLQTGVVLCELANILCEKLQTSDAAHDSSRQSDLRSLIPQAPKYRPKAQPKSFLARDNTANFIEWCQRLQVEKYCMFESEDLVLMNKPRNVLLCLLDVARIASRYGIHPPELISLEQEIDQEEEACTLIKSELQLDENVSIIPPPTVNKKMRDETLRIDHALHLVIDNPPFYGLVDLIRIGEGRYKIEGKPVFVRVLRNRHVMVRVGGGWDTLHHYLITHDSGRYTPFARLANRENNPPPNVKTPLSAFSSRVPRSAVKSKAAPRTKSAHSSRLTSKRRLLASATDLDGNVLKSPITVSFNKT